MSDHVYKQVRLTGSSTESSDAAVQRAISKASETLHGLRWFQVIDTRGHVENGKIQHWQVTVEVGFTLED